MRQSYLLRLQSQSYKECCDFSYSPCGVTRAKESQPEDTGSQGRGQNAGLQLPTITAWPATGLWRVSLSMSLGSIQKVVNGPFQCVHEATKQVLSKKLLPVLNWALSLTASDSYSWASKTQSLALQTPLVTDLWLPTF